ncbi:MAG: aldolase/citrate lyase family protein [Campylobacterota bacterium]|nr:aldolase/citrate lyase family protein [Campylobacterota bacterium]
MIFKNLSEIETIPINERLQHLGTKRKTPCMDRTFRSNMMLNPLNLKHLNRIDESDADMITLNLEDAIAPSRKREALHNIALALSHLDESNSFIIVRTNPIDEGGDDEIAFLNDFAFDAIRIPKVIDQTEIARALTILSKERELHISLETAQAFQTLNRLRIDERFTTVNLGILDLLSSMGLPQSILQIGNPTIDYILSKFLVDAKSSGLNPISFMYQEYRDRETFTEWCQREKMMGFATKACMGPAQVTIANEIFSIDDSAIRRARDIKQAFERESSREIHGFMDVEYGFIDEPIYRDALLLIDSYDTN